MRITMIAMTTSSSISVNAVRFVRLAFFTMIHSFIGVFPQTHNAGSSIRLHSFKPRLTRAAASVRMESSYSTWPARNARPGPISNL